MSIDTARILAIADLFIPVEVMRAALHQLQPEKLDVVDWPNQDRQELHHRVRNIEKHGPEVESAPDAVWDLAPEVTMMITHMCPIGTELIARAPNLSMIGVCRAGTENIDHPSAADRGIPVINVPGRNAIAVAEYTVGMMIAESRNIAKAHLEITQGSWKKDFSNRDQFTELHGKTVGLIGFGMIGQFVAERLLPFGLQLLVYDPFQSKENVESYGGRLVSLNNLLTRSDFISLHARRQAAEPPLIGAHELEMMKQTAFLINTARAGLVDTSALIDALQAKRIAGAALDVYEEEPLPTESPLRRLDNVTLTPHLAGSTVEAFHGSPTILVKRIEAEWLNR